MLKTLAISLATVATLAVTGVASAAPSQLPSGTSCKGPAITVPAGTIKTIKATGTRINVGNGSIVTVTGDDNCIVAGTGDALSVTGISNYVSAKASSVTLHGTNNYFQSQGGNAVLGNGNHCDLNKTTDSSVGCVQ